MPAQSTTTSKRSLPYNYIHGGDAVFSVRMSISSMLVTQVGNQ